jgi:hypothetical protein
MFEIKTKSKKNLIKEKLNKEDNFIIKKNDAIYEINVPEKIVNICLNNLSECGVDLFDNLFKEAHLNLIDNYNRFI